MAKFSKQYEKGYADGRQSVINDRKYNGWSNYETWNVKLWMDNDEGQYNYWRGRAEQAIEESEARDSFTRSEVAALLLADELKLEHTENMPEVTGTYSDLLSGALSDVDWYEIANSIVEDLVADHPELLTA
jgi:hypothetical protein